MSLLVSAPLRKAEPSSATSVLGLLHHLALAVAASMGTGAMVHHGSHAVMPGSTMPHAVIAMVSGRRHHNVRV